MKEKYMYIGKGIATFAVWAGCGFLGHLGGGGLLAIIVVTIGGIVGTMAIWSPESVIS